MTAPAWPGVVWSAAALGGLDGRAREEIAAAGALRRVAARQTVYRDGDPADALFVVVEGVVEVHLRAAGRGETFGEEAFVDESVFRRGDATAVEAATVASIPGALLRRVLERGASRGASRVGLAMRRAAARERLRSSRLASRCTDADLDLLLDALEHVHLARGETVFQEGDTADRAFVVASGLVRLIRRNGTGAPASPAHLGAGELLGEENVVAREPRTYSAVAAGPSWLLSVRADAMRELAARVPRVLEQAGRVRAERFAAGAAIGDGARGERSVLGDLHRFQVARSLVLIDEASCVRCGHCSWSCASAHDDGISRLLRRGDVLTAKQEPAERARALLVATSCQHCESPACMPVCPTGAIARRPGGEVSLRADLCTGCGACAKACTWEAIRMAPLERGGSVAVKCDLCADRSSGPACVEACPTAAITRVVPSAAVEDVRVALGAEQVPRAAAPRAVDAWPFIGSGLAIAALAWNGASSPLASGAVAGGALLVLGAHGPWKRLARRFGRVAYLVHVSVAPIAVAAVAHHVGGRLHSNAAGALAVATGLALASGLAGVVAYVAIPPRLARLETRGALPEDLPARAKEIETRAFAELTGKSDRVKAIFAHLIRPYARARLGALGLVVRGGSAAEEEARLHARIGRVLQGRGVRPEDVDPLVRTAVESRSVAAQTWLQAALRGWLPVHVVAAAVATVLLAFHVFVEVLFR